MPFAIQVIQIGVAVFQHAIADIAVIACLLAERCCQGGDLSFVQFGC